MCLVRFEHPPGTQSGDLGCGEYNPFGVKTHEAVRDVGAERVLQNDPPHELGFNSRTASRLGVTVPGNTREQRCRPPQNEGRWPTAPAMPSDEIPNLSFGRTK